MSFQPYYCVFLFGFVSTCMTALCHHRSDFAQTIEGDGDYKLWGCGDVMMRVMQRCSHWRQMTPTISFAFDVWPPLCVLCISIRMSSGPIIAVIMAVSAVLVFDVWPFVAVIVGVSAVFYVCHYGWLIVAVIVGVSAVFYDRLFSVGVVWCGYCSMLNWSGITREAQWCKSQRKSPFM